MWKNIALIVLSVFLAYVGTYEAYRHWISHQAKPEDVWKVEHTEDHIRGTSRAMIHRWAEGYHGPGDFYSANDIWIHCPEGNQPFVVFNFEMPLAETGSTEVTYRFDSGIPKEENWNVVGYKDLRPDASGSFLTQAVSAKDVWLEVKTGTAARRQFDYPLAGLEPLYKQNCLAGAATSAASADQGPIDPLTADMAIRLEFPNKILKYANRQNKFSNIAIWDAGKSNKLLTGIRLMQITWPLAMFDVSSTQKLLVTANLSDSDPDTLNIGCGTCRLGLVLFQYSAAGKSWKVITERPPVDTVDDACGNLTSNRHRLLNIQLTSYNREPAITVERAWREIPGKTEIIHAEGRDIPITARVPPRDHFSQGRHQMAIAGRALVHRIPNREIGPRNLHKLRLGSSRPATLCYG